MAGLRLQSRQCRVFPVPVLGHPALPPLPLSSSSKDPIDCAGTAQEVSDTPPLVRSADQQPQSRQQPRFPFAVEPAMLIGSEIVTQEFLQGAGGWHYAVTTQALPLPSRELISQEDEGQAPSQGRPAFRLGKHGKHGRWNPGLCAWNY